MVLFGVTGLAFVKESQSNIETIKELNNNHISNNRSIGIEKIDSYFERQFAHMQKFYFAYANDANVRKLLDPFVLENYDCMTEFVDITDDVVDKYSDLTKEEKEKYPAIHDYAEKEFEIVQDENGNERYGLFLNPNSRFTKWRISGADISFLPGKNGNTYDALPFDEVDWDKMINRSPKWFVNTDGEWHADEQRFSVGDKGNWNDNIRAYINEIKAKPESERKMIVVYSIDAIPIT